MSVLFALLNIFFCKSKYNKHIRNDIFMKNSDFNKFRICLFQNLYFINQFKKVFNKTFPDATKYIW